MALNFLKRLIDRRLVGICWRTALSLSVTSMLLTSAPARAEEQLAALAGTTFAARDAMKQTNKPDLSSYGLKKVTVAYENSLWPSGASKLQPDTTYIAKTYIPKIKNSNPDVVIIDIETWKLRTDSTATEVAEFIAKFKKVISVFRTNLPTAKIGVYLWMPERNWLAPCGDPKKRASRTTSWHNRNLKLQTLADTVDIIVPSLYTFYGDTASIACWPEYARANIAEARTYGKPVWAFLWMKYHTDQTKFIPAAFWRTQLETVYSLADGVVLWSKSGADTWSSTAPWWLETKAFLSGKALN